MPCTQQHQMHARGTGKKQNMRRQRTTMSVYVQILPSAHVISLNMYRRQQLRAFMGNRNNGSKVIIIRVDQELLGSIGCEI